MPGGKKDPEYAKQNLLSTEPTPKQAVNADLGGKVVYLGNDVEKSSTLERTNGELRADLAKLEATGTARHGSDVLAAGSVQNSHVTARAPKRVVSLESAPRAAG